MCFDGLTRSDTFDYGMDIETICTIGYTNTPCPIQALGGKRVTPSDY